MVRTESAVVTEAQPGSASRQGASRQGVRDAQDLSRRALGGPWSCRWASPSNRGGPGDRGDAEAGVDVGERCAGRAVAAGGEAAGAIGVADDGAVSP